MKIETARKEFEDRFYAWAKEQAAAEFEGGYPLQQRIRASDVLRAIEIVQFLNKPEGLHLTLVCIRRVHSQAAARAAEPVTAEDEALFGRYRASHSVPSREEIRIRGWDKPQEHFFAMMEVTKLAYPLLRGRMPVSPQPLDMPAGLVEKVKQAVAGQDLSKTFTPLSRLPKEERKARDAQVLKEYERFKIDRKALRSAVTAELSRSLGAKRKKETSREDNYEVPVGPWIVSTMVDFGSGGLGGFQLRYSQGIRHSSGEALTHHPTLAVTSMSWLGPGVAWWDLLTNDNLEEAAVVMSILCTRFVEATRSLLRGLQ